MERQEANVKKALLSSLMKCPHKKLDETIPVFAEAMHDDPLFTGKACYALTLNEFNQIRDLEEAGISFLLTSKYPDHREAGRILFQKLEPFRAFRVSAFIRKSLKSNRQVQGSITDYLRGIESNDKRFKGAIKVAGSKLHKMYEFYHIKPCDAAQKILFDNVTPEGDVDILEVLKNTTDPNEQAEIIITNKIPYRQATSVIKEITPTIWIALIDVMTIPEIVNSRAIIEKSGILEDSRIRELYESKLSMAGTSKKVSASTLGERKSTKGSDDRLTQIIKNAEQKKIDSGRRITCDTDIFIDVSGSMAPAIELAKRVCPYVASLCDANLRVFAFNEIAFEIKTSKERSIEDFRAAFSLLRANGDTSLGSALRKSVSVGNRPEQVIYITDQHENRAPMTVDVFTREADDMRFIFLNIAGNFGVSHKVAQSLNAYGADVSEFEFKSRLDTPGFYADMDNFSTLLTKGGYISLVEKIMSLELPKRSK
jgi:hypothetical protein